MGFGEGEEGGGDGENGSFSSKGWGERRNDLRLAQTQSDSGFDPGRRPLAAEPIEGHSSPSCRHPSQSRLDRTLVALLR